MPQIALPTVYRQRYARVDRVGEVFRFQGNSDAALQNLECDMPQDADFMLVYATGWEGGSGQNRFGWCYFDDFTNRDRHFVDWTVDLGHEHDWGAYNQGGFHSLSKASPYFPTPGKFRFTFESKGGYNEGFLISVLFFRGVDPVNFLGAYLDEQGSLTPSKTVSGHRPNADMVIGATMGWDGNAGADETVEHRWRVQNRIDRVRFNSNYHCIASPLNPGDNFIEMVAQGSSTSASLFVLRAANAATRTESGNVYYLPGSGGTAPTTITADELAQAQAIAEATISQDHEITAAELAQLQVPDTVSIVYQEPVDSDGNVQLQVPDTVDVSQTADIDGAELAQLQVADLVGISQDHQIDGLELAQDQTIDTVTITVAGSVTGQLLEQLQLIEGAVISQEHQLSAVTLAQLQFFEAVTIIEEDGSINSQELAQLQELGATVITQDHQLTADGLIQVQVIGGGSFSIPSDYIAPGRVWIVTPRDRAVKIAKRLRAFRMSRK